MANTNCLQPSKFGGGGVVAEIFRDLQNPTAFGGGGGVVAEMFSDLQGVVAEIFPVNNRPYIRVNQTCIVFCPNNLDSLPELISTSCPNWGGGQLTPPPPIRLWPFVSINLQETPL